MTCWLASLWLTCTSTEQTLTALPKCAACFLVRLHSQKPCRSMATCCRGFVREAKPERRRRLSDVEWLDNGRPLPGTIHVQGIDHPITAGVEYGNFYRCAACQNINLAGGLLLDSMIYRETRTVSSTWGIRWQPMSGFVQDDLCLLFSGADASSWLVLSACSPALYDESDTAFMHLYMADLCEHQSQHIYCIPTHLLQCSKIFMTFALPAGRLHRACTPSLLQ